MLAAIGRLVAITIGALTLTFLAVVFVRWMGLHQQFQPPPHPWFNEPKWTIVQPPMAELCERRDSATNPSWIIEVPIQKSGSKWQIPCANAPIDLADYLKSVPSPRILLNVRATEPGDLDKLVETVAPFERQKQFAAWATAQKVARALRQMAPQWLFAADSASLLRLHVFASYWLEPALDFWPDFVVASQNKEDGSKINEREVNELHRRKKRVLWDERSGSPAPFANDGLLTERSAELRK